MILKALGKEQLEGDHVRKTPNKYAHPMRHSQIEIAVRKFSAQRSDLLKLDKRVEKLEQKPKQISRALASK